MSLWSFLQIERPIIQAPMAGAQDAELTIAVSQAGGLGSLPCAMLSAEKIREDVRHIREKTDKPFNLNFFCHKSPVENRDQLLTWKKTLEPYYKELGLSVDTAVAAPSRKPFDDEMCSLVEEIKPAVVSFHFGLPEKHLLDRVKRTKALVLSSATTVAEAQWLEAHGCDAVIAQGAEAGGHRAMFLEKDIATQVGLFALLPQISDAVKIPVIASGGIADKRGVQAALALGAAAVQIGTAFLLCPEARISKVHRIHLKDTKNFQTAMTNIFSGRPARGMMNRLMKELGPMSSLAPDFPLAGGVLAPLKAATEPQGSGDFMSMWAGQAAPLAREIGAAELIRSLF